MKKTIFRTFIFITLASVMCNITPLPSAPEKAQKKGATSKRHIVTLFLGSICAGILVHHLIKKKRQQRKQQRFAAAAAPQASTHVNQDDDYAAKTPNKFPEFNYYNYGSYCSLCWDYSSKENTVRLHCDHTYCRNCLNDHLNEPRKNKQLPICPDPGCRRNFTREDLNRITKNKKDIEEFDNIAFEQGLKKTRGLKYCPNPKCGFAFINECDTAASMTCQKCQQTYCSRCLKPHISSFWNVIFGDNECARDDDVDAYAKKHDAKRCPGCKAMIEKNQGCDHMTCQQCKYEFCWQCGAHWIAYGHHCFI